MELPENLQFLTATRFWVMVIGALSLYLRTKGWIGDAETILIATIAGGFITVATIDRISEKKLDVARIMTDTTVKESEKNIE